MKAMTDSSSYTDKLIEKDVWVIVLLRGEDENLKDVFHYVAVKGEDVEKILAEQNSCEFFEIEDYGIIIDSGFGAPSSAIRTRLARSFNLTEVAY